MMKKENEENHKKETKLEWTGERFLPWAGEADIHYEHLHRYAFASQFAKGKKVLDLASGEGYGAYMYAQTAEYVLGVDIDKQSIKHARSRYMRKNLQFKIGDMTNVPVEDEKVFDVIVCYEAIEHIKQHEKLISEVKRLLKEDGLFIVSTPNKLHYTDETDYHNPFHPKELYFDEFRDLINSSFKNVAFYGQRIFTTSNIWSMFDNPDVYSEFIIDKGTNGFTFFEKDKKAAMYFVAVASDRAIDPLIDSFLVDSSNTLIEERNQLTTNLENAINEKGRDITDLENAINEKDRDITDLDERIQGLDAEVAGLRGELEVVFNSRSWKLTKPLRWMSTYARKLRRKVKTIRYLFNRQSILIKKSGLSDTAYYLDQNPDIAESGVNPLAHYLHSGVDEGKDPNLCMTIPTCRKFRILYLDGVGVGSDFVSYRYRISNIREALTFVDVESGETNIFELSNNLQQLFDYDVLVLFRAGWNEGLQKIVERCRALHIPVIFDLDDYVFEPAIATEEYISGIHKWTKKQKQEYLHGVQSYRQTLMACDYFIASTDYIAERAADLDKKVFVINNGLSLKLLELTSHLRIQQDAENSHIVEIVYMSGTQTHQADFRTIVPTLAKVLKENDHVHLFVFGYLDLEEFHELLPFKERIRTQSFVEWDKIQDYVNHSHINISPLEIGNPFCEAKSELKYFEGAAYGLVTVAAATNSFKKAIINGQTGYICETEDEWYCTLTNLVRDKDLRNRITQNAIIQAINCYHPINTAKQALMTYREIIQDYRTQHNIPESSLSVSWLVPPPFHGSGGHNDIFIAANEMAKRGHQVTIYFTMMQAKNHAPKAVKKYIEQHFGYAVLFNIVIGTHMLRNCDVLIATHYTTAQIVENMKNRVYMPVYFVQDFEPYFNPVGSEYFEAEFGYQRSDFFFITLGKWLAKVLTEKYGARAKSINFWVDRDFYYSSQRSFVEKTSKPKVIFFARPAELMHRRCFSLGIKALAEFHQKMPDVEIVLYGANNLKRYPIDFPYRDMGVLPKKELGDLYRSADIGVMFSTTNPSLVVFEAMACGLPVVDLNVLDSYARHGKDYPAFLVLPDSEIIANALSYLLRHPEKLSELSKKSLEFTNDLASSEESLQHITLILEEELHGNNS